jgi:caffeoyl-CoA O-methyltransferase
LFHFCRYEDLEAPAFKKIVMFMSDLLTASKNYKKLNILPVVIIVLLIFCQSFFIPLKAQNLIENDALDERVKKFLSENRGKWRDMNIPESDGRLLYDIITRNNYKNALEIGTSTGHSAIWIAWALSKTGGKLITIDIDEDRNKTAVENFRKAGLSDYIDARVADAHVLVKELEGPFDFIFSDADKDWYKNYFIELDPKLKVGGCFTAHNVSEPRGGSVNRFKSGQAVFLDYVQSLKNYETTVNSTGAGVSISYKRTEK